MSLPPLRSLTAAAALALLLTGCGDDQPAATSGTSGTSGDTGAQGAPEGAGGGQPRMPGTFGEIAAVDGDVLQVQNQMTGQVAVTVTGDTTITDQAAATLADVTQGVCVVVRSAETADDNDGSDAGTATEVRAASVAVSPAGDDGCTGGLGGPGGGRPGGPGGDGERPTDLPSDFPTDRPTDRPSGMPSGMPSGAPGGPGGRMGGLGTAGQVTSVTDGGFVVEGPNGTVTVTVGDDTTYTRQVDADATALSVGRCVRVQGDADSTGAVTADTLQVSDKVNDQCAL